MYTLKTRQTFILLTCSLFLLSWKTAGPCIKHVDLVFCVDLSASTNGILNDIRDKMWDISNGILKENESTDLRIAVVGYGRPSFGESNGYVKILSGLSNEFDHIHYDLHQLKAVVEKGDQQVPNALFETYKHLKWSKAEDAEKMVYLIGNGSAYTGSINLYDLCEEYRKNNIRINAVYVIQSRTIAGHMTSYKKIAEITNGQFYVMKARPRMEINKNIDEAELAIYLSDSLNNTFMFYSKDAPERKKYLYESDKNTLKMGTEYFYSRLFYKTSLHYLESNVPFDLTSYMLKYHKMPDRVNLDYLASTEKTSDVSVIEKRARNNAFTRQRLNEEIQRMFKPAELNSTAVSDSLLEGFVLGSFQ